MQTIVLVHTEPARTISSASISFTSSLSDFIGHTLFNPRLDAPQIPFQRRADDGGEAVSWATVRPEASPIQVED